MPAALINALLAVAKPQGPVPLERFRTVFALLMGVAILTVIFATLWLLAARRRARIEPARKPKRRGKPPTAWDESARRLRLPADDNPSDADDLDSREGSDDDDPPGPDTRRPR